ncbi:hypothetical protein L9F63_023101 [Diploptera punctata]|uniref:Major facilitator superfamily domain-containing protein 9 n=1 Tax=Diploptera punctata TaxID=6984 RepID=A0AAD8E957_DIPPU|nr:hypothetical protein L9F63_023101 [Diploptera punctata]
MSISKVRLLYAVSFLDLFACSLAIPLLSSHLRSLGASHFTIGVLSSMYAGLQLLSGPIIGSWSDIRGHCFVLQLSLIACSFLYFILGAATAIPIIILPRIGLGVMKHTQALCRTLLTDVVPSKDQLAVQGRLVSFGAVGFIVGPAIGGHMAELDGGFYYVCVAVMIFFWINYGIVYFFLSDIRNEHRGDKKSDTYSHNEGNVLEEYDYQISVKSEFPGIKVNNNVKDNAAVINSSTRNALSEVLQAVTNLSRINWPVYWDVFALKFLLGFSQAIHYQNFTLILKDMYDITPKWIGYTISLQGFVGAMTGFIAEWISKFYKNDENNFHRTLHGFIVLSISFMCISFAPSLMFVVIYLIPLSASASLLRITTSEIIMQRTPPNQRGSLIGSGQSMSSVARMLAPLCSGIAYDMFSFHGLSILKISSAFLATFLTAFLVSSSKIIKKRD